MVHTEAKKGRLKMNDEEQNAELTNALHHTKARRMYERYQTILLYLVGYPLKEIAQITHKTPNTVVNYLKAYETG